MAILKVMIREANTWLARLGIIFIAASLTFVLLIGITRFYAFNLSYYQSEFTKVGTYERLGEEADRDTERLIAYIRGQSDQLGIETFNDREIAHMADVKALLRGLEIALGAALTFAALLVLIMFWTRLRKPWALVSDVLLWTGLMTLGALVLAGVIALLGFSSAFNVFHGIFFKEGTWAFYRTDRLIQLFPLQFFFDVTLRIVIDTVLAGVVLSVSGLFMRKKFSRQSS